MTQKDTVLLFLLLEKKGRKRIQETNDRVAVSVENHSASITTISERTHLAFELPSPLVPMVLTFLCVSADRGKRSL